MWPPGLFSLRCPAPSCSIRSASATSNSAKTCSLGSAHPTASSSSKTAHPTASHSSKTAHPPASSSSEADHQPASSSAKTREVRGISQASSSAPQASLAAVLRVHGPPASILQRGHQRGEGGQRGQGEPGERDIQQECEARVRRARPLRGDCARLPKMDASSRFKVSE